MASEPTEQLGFIGLILQPGSSLNSTFLYFLDGAFVALFLVFIMLAFVTSGNPHIFALMFIELALWASVKWFVHELKRSREEPSTPEKKDQ
ncbi:V-type ATPase assembly factor PKR1 [Leucoagaricus sp. SymC.cos]|nr:V-type ATPase assembly factor PKR1 [Leucoagaricus sp. SymC.cos]